MDTDGLLLTILMFITHMIKWNNQNFKKTNALNLAPLTAGSLPSARRNAQLSTRHIAA